MREFENYREREGEKVRVKEELFLNFLVKRNNIGVRTMVSSCVGQLPATRKGGKEAPGP